MRLGQGLGENHVRDTVRKVPATLPTLAFKHCFPQMNNPREVAHTAVAFTVSHLHPDEVLHPERVTDAALGEGITATMLRAVQLTR